MSIFSIFRQKRRPFHNHRLTRRPRRLSPRIEVLEGRALPAVFGPPGPFAATDGSCYVIAAGDFNGDGKLDVATASGETNQLTAFTGNGDGSFTRTDHHRFLSNSPDAIRSADVNNDGRLDLIFALTNGEAVGVTLGRGDGTFLPYVRSTVLGTPFGLDLGDLNGDGFLDVVTGNLLGNNTAVLLGNGDGTFRAAVYYATGGGEGVAVADFNGDAVPDVAVTDSDADTVRVLLNNGTGTLTAPVPYATGRGGRLLATGDLNLDGAADLVINDYNGGTVSVLRGNGDGTFQTRLSYPAGRFPFGIVVDDFDQDGRPDVAVTNVLFPLQPGSENAVSVFRGNGDGTLQPREIHPSGPEPTALVSGDFNGDAAPDVVVTNHHAAQVAFLPNITAAPPTIVLGTLVNFGAAQRSMVQSLAVVFSREVTLDEGAIEVRTQAGAAVDFQAFTFNVAGLTLSILVFTGEGVINGSLADGNYTLTIHGDRILDRGGRAVDGDLNGTPGGDHTTAFYRLFGDSDGDRDVDDEDSAAFASTFGLSAGDRGFLPYFDYDGDGRIDPQDRNQFRRRLGTVLAT